MQFLFLDNRIKMAMLRFGQSDIHVNNAFSKRILLMEIKYFPCTVGTFINCVSLLTTLKMQGYGGKQGSLHCSSPYSGIMY